MNIKRKIYFVVECEEYKKFAQFRPSSPSGSKLFNIDEVHTSVVGGELTLLGEFPHMAALGWKRGEEIEFNCGATLISENFVMTAAHCLSAEK